MLIGKIKSKIRAQARFQLARLESGRPKFSCPVCGFHGVFVDKREETGVRLYAQCPKCGALERHRLQSLAMRELESRRNFSKLRILHIAPEKFFEVRFRSACAEYVSADISGIGVDRKEDLTKLSFPNGSFDLVYASHVLEHIPDDRKALDEIRRVLVPGGIAVLPVPIVSDVTVEYGAPNPDEHDHVRAPGLDYFERYRPVFGQIDVYESASFPEKHQLYVYEDRSCWPTPKLPKRRRMLGKKHSDYVPVCCVAPR